MGGVMSGRAGLITASVLVPTLLLALSIVLLYVCCARRFRLNWYEKSVLQEEQQQCRVTRIASSIPGKHRHASSSSSSSSSDTDQESEKQPLCGAARGGSQQPLSYTVWHGSGSGLHVPLSTPRYVLLTPEPECASSMGSWHSSGTLSSGLTDPIQDPHSNGSSALSMANSLTSVIRRSSLQAAQAALGLHHSLSEDNSQQHSPGASTGSKEQFWVPPTMAEKKRAQSLIPHLGLLQQSQESEDSGSPNRTPLCTSSTSLQEMTFTYPPDRLQGDGAASGASSGSAAAAAAHQRRRRASMQDALDHTKINARLYAEKPPVLRQDSIHDVAEEDGPLGAVHLSLQYNAEQSLLTVRLIQARDLLLPDGSTSANPYARLSLLPRSRQKLHSRIQKNTLCPQFEEDFIFEVVFGQLAQQTLEVVICHRARSGEEENLGQLLLHLDQLDLSENTVLWAALQTYDISQQQHGELGDMMFSLSYLPSAERLTVVVAKARNLKQPEDSKQVTSPYVKVSLVCAGRRLKKKKTSTKRGTQNPIWNEALVFSLGREFLKNINLEFIVYNDNLLGNSGAIGHIDVGPATDGAELAHWNEVLTGGKTQVQWHRLSTVHNTT